MDEYCDRCGRPEDECKRDDACATLTTQRVYNLCVAYLAGWETARALPDYSPGARRQGEEAQGQIAQLHEIESQVEELLDADDYVFAYGPGTVILAGVGEDGAYIIERPITVVN